MSQDERGTKGSLFAQILFYGGVVLSVVFLVMSFVSWNPWLGMCALALAALLTKRLDIVGIAPSREARAGAHTRSQGK